MALDNIFKKMRKDTVKDDAVGVMSVREVLNQRDTAAVLDEMVNSGDPRYDQLHGAMTALLKGEAIADDQARRDLDTYAQGAARVVESTRQMQTFLTPDIVKEMASASPGSEFSLLVRQVGPEHIVKLLPSEYWARLSVSNPVVYGRMLGAMHVYQEQEKRADDLAKARQEIAKEWGIGDASSLEPIIQEPDKKKRKHMLRALLKEKGVSWLNRLIINVFPADIKKAVVTGQPRAYAAIQEAIQREFEELLANAGIAPGSLDALLGSNTDASTEDVRKRAAAFVAFGREEDIEKKDKNDFGAAAELLKWDEQELKKWFAFPGSNELINRFIEFKRRSAHDDSGVDTKTGNNKQIQTRVQAWWQGVVMDKPVGAGGPHSREDYIGRFLLTDYLPFIMAKFGVRGTMWEDIAKDFLYKQATGSTGFNLVHKLKTDTRPENC